MGPREPLCAPGGERYSCSRGKGAGVLCRWRRAQSPPPLPAPTDCRQQHHAERTARGHSWPPAWPGDQSSGGPAQLPLNGLLRWTAGVTSRTPPQPPPPPRGAARVGLDAAAQPSSPVCLPDGSSWSLSPACRRGGRVYWCMHAARLRNAMRGGGGGRPQRQRNGGHGRSPSRSAPGTIPLSFDTDRPWGFPDSARRRQAKRTESETPAMTPATFLVLTILLCASSA